MKCLYFLYGEYRTFETAVKTWNILNIPNLDIVIHSPNTTSEYLGSQNFKEITANHFNILGNPKVFLHHRLEYKKTDLHVLHHSYRFLSKYLNECDVVYDYIFIGRLDSTFYLEDWEKFISIKRKPLFAISKPYIGRGNDFIPDHTFFGNHYIIKDFVDKLPPQEHLENSHRDIARYIHNNFECDEWPHFDSIHIRPNMTHLFEKYFLNNGTIKNIDSNYINFLEKDFYPNYHMKLDREYKTQFD